MRRRSRLVVPADVVARLGLSRSERPLAWAEASDGRWLVGTLEALIIDDGGAARRIGWEQIERADWSHDDETLAVVETAGWGEPEVRTELVLADPGLLLDLVRERVTRSVAISRFAPVRGRRGITVVGRRSPTGAGEISWSYVLSVGLDPDDADVIDVVEQTLADAQNELAHL